MHNPIWQRLILSLGLLLIVSSCSSPSHSVEHNGGMPALTAMPTPSSIPATPSVTPVLSPYPHSTPIDIPLRGYPIAKTIIPLRGYPIAKTIIPPTTPTATPPYSPTPTPYPLNKTTFAQLMKHTKGAIHLEQVSFSGLVLSGGEYRVSLSRPFCDSPFSVRGEWSHDHRYIAWICRKAWNDAAAYLLDIQTGETRQISHSSVVDMVWSPVEHRLFVNEQGDDLVLTDSRDTHTYPVRSWILDATTGITTALPLEVFWRMTKPYKSEVISPAVSSSILESNVPGVDLTDFSAALSWSPDGSRIALVSGDLYVMDSDGGNIRAIVQASDARVYQADGRRDEGLFYDRPIWIDDDTLSIGRNVLVEGCISPSCANISVTSHVTISTGDVQIVSP